MLANDLAWMSDGACRTVGPAPFFPTDGAGVETAKRICAGCPVREVCLEYAVSNRINHGVWGGESERSRQRISRARRRARRSAA